MRIRKASEWKIRDCQSGSVHGDRWRPQSGAVKELKQSIDLYFTNKRITL
ncbi:MAG: hypothetical protein ACLR1A_01995 [Eubacterium ventriosum]